MKKICIVFVLLLFTSCASMTTKDKAITQGLVEVATARILMEYPEWADGVFYTAESVKGLMTTGTISSDVVQVMINEEVNKAGLTPEEVRLILTFVSTLYDLSESPSDYHNMATWVSNVAQRYRQGD